jgi:hypothetical protein
MYCVSKIPIKLQGQIGWIHPVCPGYEVNLASSLQNVKAKMANLANHRIGYQNSDLPGQTGWLSNCTVL